jgi:hypothetical protein
MKQSMHFNDMLDVHNSRAMNTHKASAVQAGFDFVQRLAQAVTLPLGEDIDALASRLNKLNDMRG